MTPAQISQNISKRLSAPRTCTNSPPATTCHNPAGRSNTTQTVAEEGLGSRCQLVRVQGTLSQQATKVGLTRRHPFGCRPSALVACFFWRWPRSRPSGSTLFVSSLLWTLSTLSHSLSILHFSALLCPLLSPSRPGVSPAFLPFHSSCCSFNSC